MYVLQKQFELGHENGDCLGNQWYSCPYHWKSFRFSKDGQQDQGRLVLSVVWCWRDTQISLGLCFSFDRTIKGGYELEV